MEEVGVAEVIIEISEQNPLTQIPKFGIVVVLILGALGFRDRKETDVLQLICSVSLIAKRSGFSRRRTTTSTRTIVLWLHCAVREARSIYLPLTNQEPLRPQPESL